MNVLIIGNHQNAQTFSARFPGHSIEIEAGDLVYDLCVWFYPVSPWNPLLIKKEVPLLVDCTTTSLAQQRNLLSIDNRPLMGFTSLNTFFERNIFELSVFDQSHIEPATTIMASLGTEIEIVEDRVGLVTPRIIAMIINEAYYTLQEGTADATDIDIAMKLGTNYPFGPFEWAEKIGINSLFTLLDSLHKITGEDRYIPCPLLKKKALGTI